MTQEAANIQTLPIARLWEAPIYTDLDLCLFDLISFWELNNHVDAFDGASKSGSVFSAMTAADETYVDDTTRGGAPGAIAFTIFPPTYLEIRDAAGAFASRESFTLAGYFLLTSKADNAVLLSYTDVTGTVYELIFHLILDRFVWTVQGAAGYNPTIADGIGAPALDTWYWLEVYFDAALNLAGIRGTATRSAEGDPLILPVDTAAVPGGIAFNPSALSPGVLRIGGATGNNSIALGTPLQGFAGRAASLGSWQRALTDIERGILNVPTDYPFAIATPARLTAFGEIRITEDGDTRITE